MLKIENFGLKDSREWLLFDKFKSRKDAEFKSDSIIAVTFGAATVQFEEIAFREEGYIANDFNCTKSGYFFY